MVSINYASREVCCKIVYYGPGLSGKTTNLQYVHAKVPNTTRGDLISLATEADRTLYFDFLPINIGAINGFAAKFQLYTVPGQVYYNATRKLVLRGVDGLVFVADSQPDKMDENIESLQNLEDNLREYGYDLDELPMVIQYNKRDLPGVMSVEDLNEQLNTRGRPHFEASATIGNGVFGTLKLIIRMVLDKAKSPSGPKAADAKQDTVIPAPSAEVMKAANGPAPAPATESETATAVAEPPAEPELARTRDEDSVRTYRPYPGSSASEGGTRTATLDRTVSHTDSDEASAKNIVNADSSAPETMTGQPLMAPSLRRRKIKKQGFFKKLFGRK